MQIDFRDHLGHKRCRFEKAPKRPDVCCEYCCFHWQLCARLISEQLRNVKLVQLSVIQRIQASPDVQGKV